jgi:hypothetical protein
MGSKSQRVAGVVVAAAIVAVASAAEPVAAANATKRCSLSPQTHTVAVREAFARARKLPALPKTGSLEARRSEYLKVEGASPFSPLGLQRAARCAALFVPPVRPLPVAARRALRRTTKVVFRAKSVSDLRLGLLALQRSSEARKLPAFRLGIGTALGILDEGAHSIYAPSWVQRSTTSLFSSTAFRRPEAKSKIRRLAGSVVLALARADSYGAVGGSLLGFFFLPSCRPNPTTRHCREDAASAGLSRAIEVSVFKAKDTATSAYETLKILARRTK